MITRYAHYAHILAYHNDFIVAIVYRGSATAGTFNLHAGKIVDLSFFQEKDLKRKEK